jgi:hypothetical protein
MSPKGGVEVTEVKKTVGGEGGIANAVVVGQDPEEEGVGITVSIDSVYGDIVHEEMISRCNYSGVEIPGKSHIQCTPNNDNSDDYYIHGPSEYYYWESQCRKVRTHGAVRKIKDVRIWLEPSPETESWLGWAQGEPGGKATLRYMFPDKWLVATWTEDGFTTSGTPDNSWTDPYYQNWLEQMQGFNFLAGDTQKILYLWSVTMVETANPIQGGPSSLGIFGDFLLSGITYPLPYGYYPGTHWRVNYWTLNEWTDLHRARSKPNAANQLDEGLTDITIVMEHIPLDLPGKWFIGIEVEMTKASIDYYSQQRVESTALEEWSVYDSKWFPQEDIGYNKDYNYFYSYVLISSPCNPLEENNCVDGTW